MTQRIRQVEFQLPNGHAANDAISVQMQRPSIIHLLLLLLLWHAPPLVRSAKRIQGAPKKSNPLGKILYL